MADAGRTAPTLDDDRARHRKRPGEAGTPGRTPTPRPRLLALLVAAVVLIGGYLLLSVATTGRVSHDTSVAGVPIGGLTADEAADRLERELAPRLDQKVTVTAAGSSVDLIPSRSGVRLDTAETVGQVSGRSLSPARLWHALAGGGAIRPELSTVPDDFAQATAPLAAKTRLEPRDGAVTFAGGKAVARNAVMGSALDPVTASSALAASLAGVGLTADGPIDLPLSAVEPDISPADVATAMRDFAGPAMSGPLTLKGKGGTKTLQVTPAQLSVALSMKPEDGRLQPVLDQARLRSAIGGSLAGLNTAPTSATFRLAAGKPTVVPARNGGVADANARFDGVIDALAQPAGSARVATVRLTPVPPGLTTTEATKIGVKHKVSSYTTTYPDAAYRNVNIGRAVNLLDGTIVKPGGTFSLNETLGERTAARGFVKGIVISGGRFRQGFGGGVSQLSTTTYNAAFFAGLEDIEHRAHGFYIDRYPKGREATLDWGSLDMRFRNNTPTPLVISASLRKSAPGRDGVVTVTLWGTKYWTVKQTSSKPYNVRQTGPVTDKGAQCVPQPGSDGFDIDITRWIYRGTRLDHRETYTTHYNPEAVITCAN